MKMFIASSIVCKIPKQETTETHLSSQRNKYIVTYSHTVRVGKQLSVKGYRVNILYFVGNTVFVMTPQIYYNSVIYNTKVARNNIKMNEHGYILIKNFIYGH